jgi:hypothetical protein
MDERPRILIERDLTRRGFVLAAAGAGAGLSALAQALGWLQAAGAAHAQTRPPALAPDDPAVKATMAAYADTIVPGPAGGGHHLPGALEAGVLEELYEPFYGAAPAYPVIHNDIQLQTARILGRPAAFELELPYLERERIVEECITSPGSGGINPLWVLYQGAAVLAYTSYYGTAQSALGPETIGFPPKSRGYWPRKHSYRVRFRGMTRTGNPR